MLTSIRDFLDQHSWVPGVLVAIVLFIITQAIFWFLRQQDKTSKTLDYEILSDTSILNNRLHGDVLKVTYRGREVNSPRIVRIRFTNTGNQVIKKTDFLEPCVISCGGIQILETTITDESDKNLILEIEKGTATGSSEVMLSCNTLNEEDTFTVQMVVDSRTPVQPHASSRIEGQTRKTELLSSKESWTVTAPAAVAELITALLLILAGIVLVSSDNKIHIIGWIGVGAGVALLFYAIKEIFKPRKLVVVQPHFRVAGGTRVQVVNGYRRWK